MPKCECCGQEINKERRTSVQNRALHLYLTHLAEAFNEAGLDMRKVIREDVMMPWTTMSVKEYIWRPIQKSLTGKDSTIELNKLEEITKIYDTINRHIGTKFGIYVPFPSEQNQEI